MPLEKPISQKIWQMRNERLRELPMDCRIAIIEEIVKADVRQCIENSGISDPICQSMAEESGEMEEYLLESESELHKFLKRYKGNPGKKCDKNPCDLTIKGKREELKSPHQLPIYKIKGKFYFRDERLGEYRNIKDPQDRITEYSVKLEDLQKPTKEDIEKVYGEEE